MISEGKGKSTRTRNVQSVLNISPTWTKKVCSTCHMTYNPSVSVDASVHKKYHSDFMSGINWTATLGSKSLETVTLVSSKKSSKLGQLKSSVTRETKRVVIHTIDKQNKRQVSKVEEILKMVNTELNAADDSKQWRSLAFDSSKAFILVLDNKAIGICTTDSINHAQWLILKNQKIVPDRKLDGFCIGISRIWIAPKWRNHGLAGSLLQCVMKNSVYGKILSRHQIAFSQPSFGGGLLAKSFNGVMHKSGEVLIPVYTEK
ncbi:hypothetical protein PVL30_000831 [Lodderomyces elongisporus]|uniref:uncharacterized protein n=1 Tax=Lodderomyces elongisporus TaxID=36914 RepID=UPI002924C5ED|nr:uncharacterized protein PVL30_000831 [Lodderomyces elongisporus]WLF77122.1 hypothetical protein PVL30_000831 [Lodderomyces elongisporus]